jgi:hypothetical protein
MPSCARGRQRWLAAQKTGRLAHGCGGGASVRPALRHAGHSRAICEIRIQGDRGCFTRDRRQVPRRACGRWALQRHHRVQFSSRQNYHQLRRRHGFNQQHAVGKNHDAIAQPWDQLMSPADMQVQPEHEIWNYQQHRVGL